VPRKSGSQGDLAHEVMEYVINNTNNILDLKELIYILLKFYS